MYKIFGIGIEFKLIKDSQEVLWEDTLSEKNNLETPYIGIKLALRIGKVLRPVRKFWKKGGNPWFGQNIWFVMRIPICIFPFISIAFGKRGMYLGAKVYGCDLEHYKTWCREEEFGREKKYLCPSASIRRTRLI